MSSAARGPSANEEFRSTHAIRDAIPTRAHAEMLFAMVVDLLGDEAWVETWNGETTRTLFRRESPGSNWIVPWPLLSVTRGGREGPPPILTAVPGVYEEPKQRPGPAPKIRGLGPGQVTLHDGPQHVNVCYGGDGRWFECSVSSPPQEALAGVVPALAAKTASPTEIVASFMAALDLGRHGPGRIRAPVALPHGVQAVWNCGLFAIRDALFEDRAPAGACWVAADGWTGRAIAFGATRDEAMDAWRTTVVRGRPFPETPKPPEEPLPEPSVDQSFDGESFAVHVTMRGPSSDVPWVETTLETSPAAAFQLPDAPDNPPGFGAYTRLVDAYGNLRLALIRREPRGFTLVGVPDDRPEARLAQGWWPHPIEGQTSFGKESFFAPVGCGSGGTTGLYASQLERLGPSDFRPRAYYPDAKDSNLPEAWPIEYAELLPYYQRAEALYRVCGTPDPLDPHGADAALREPPPLSQRDRALFESFEAAGLHPYRAHVGCEFVEGCGECGATLCPRACKSDAGRICLLPALRDHGAKLLADCEVVELEADQSAVRRVRCRHEGRELTIAAHVVLLAAGAFMSPILLLNSRSQHRPEGLANRSGQVGRNLMVHAHNWVAIGSKGALSPVGPKKAISANDFYVDGGTKLGTIQSLGVTVSPGTIAYYMRNRFAKLPKLLRELLDPFIRIIARIVAYPFRNAAVFAALIEDLPYHQNRVMPDPEKASGMRFEYHYPDELAVRSQLFMQHMRKRLKPRHRLMLLTPGNNLDYGHVCGTIRFGNDPATSVLDKHCRAHDVENLYVVDASFFPSSGGMNLSLTIAANALRVAEAIEAELERRQDQRSKGFDSPSGTPSVREPRAGQPG